MKLLVRLARFNGLNRLPDYDYTRSEEISGGRYITYTLRYIYVALVIFMGVYLYFLTEFALFKREHSGMPSILSVFIPIIMYGVYVFMVLVLTPCLFDGPIVRFRKKYRMYLKMTYVGLTMPGGWRHMIRLGELLPWTLVMWGVIVAVPFVYAFLIR